MLAGIVVTSLMAAGAGAAETVTFDGMPSGESPSGWIGTKTGSGNPRWRIVPDATAPSPPHVLLQSGVATYSVCLKAQSRLADGFVAVKFKPIAGKEDQAGGVVWRALDADTYYVARANALEDNITIYHTIKGRRVAFKNVNHPVKAGAWHTLRVDFQGDRFRVTFDGEPVIDARDGRLTAAGMVGLWTKADSVTAFDDFSCGEK